MLRRILGHRSLKMVVHYADPAEEAVVADALGVWRNRTGSTAGSTKEETGDGDAATG